MASVGQVIIGNQHSRKSGPVMGEGRGSDSTPSESARDSELRVGQLTEIGHVQSGRSRWRGVHLKDRTPASTPVTISSTPTAPVRLRDGSLRAA